jgi:SOS-response transcriptional repressor LexA
MTWADRTIRELKEGNVSQCRPHGGSMRGRIESGQLVTLDPNLEPKVGDAVLCRVKGNTYVHLVKAVQGHGDKRRYLIGNNRGGTNGWTSTIYGVVTDVRD